MEVDQTQGSKFAFGSYITCLSTVSALYYIQRCLIHNLSHRGCPVGPMLTTNDDILFTSGALAKIHILFIQLISRVDCSATRNHGVHKYEFLSSSSHARWSSTVPGPTQPHTPFRDVSQTLSHHAVGPDQGWKVHIRIYFCNMYFSRYVNISENAVFGVIFVDFSGLRSSFWGLMMSIFYDWRAKDFFVKSQMWTFQAWRCWPPTTTS